MPRTTKTMRSDPRSAWRRFLTRFLDHFAPRPADDGRRRSRLAGSSAEEGTDGADARRRARATIWGIRRAATKPEATTNHRNGTSEQDAC